MPEKHYTLLKAAGILGVTTQTLRNWDNAGKIRTIRTVGNQRRIPEGEIKRLLGIDSESFANADDKPKRSKTELPQFREGSIQESDEINTEIISMPAVVKNDENFILMCKNIAVYDINKSKILDEKLLPGCMLKNIMSFPQWMETRYSSKTNFSSQRLMQRAFGFYDHDYAAYATGAFSLSDCYWIKKYDDDIDFANITPYIHKEWTGTESSGIQNDYIYGSLSNLFVSGKTDKCWLDAQSLLKINSFKEQEVYDFCIALGLDNIPDTQKSDEGIILNNFTSIDVFFESMEQYGVDADTDPRKILTEKYKEQAVALFVTDYLTENNDRYPDDYGFLRDSNTGEYLYQVPFYNFDWAWSGDVIPLPDYIWENYRDYIGYLCQSALNAAKDFEYGIIIEKRANELLALM